ncbi:hypothetical protein EDC18_103145 [Natranaerovirga pectinivora]|uniref:Uncharacterized protein n=1 Tax=Natranaerovirga pectinivora TaxID=682400 RepID=A0A4V2V0D0_9FIRM|nr:ATP-binding protein [Natranaerovirga pectinivora]TCT15440.1 hypothetical protein EDC18_103145 [Natranaerovirga pectinivora]
MEKNKELHLIIYNKFEQDPIIKKLITLRNDELDYESIKITYFELCRGLIEEGNKNKWNGNLLYKYIAWCLLNEENVFSLMYEKTERKEKEPILEMVQNDINTIKELLKIDYVGIDKKLNTNLLSSLFHYNYNAEIKEEDYFNKVYEELKNGTTKSVVQSIIEFYYNVGVGQFAWYKGFRWSEEGISPIEAIEEHKFIDLIGVDPQKKKVMKNTESFLEGNKGNNVLLYGDSGTGKSSMIKAVLNEYHDKGLRMIEVYKYQFKELPNIIRTIRERPYKWILFFDDLSFEDFEIEYKYLKAIIEGSLEKKSNNILIYATSNRRHLITESWKDRVMGEDEVHTNDTMEEKLSLSERFGLSIMFLTTNQKQYLEIVKAKALKEKIDIDDEKLLRLALQWELQHGSFSGRVAEQFIYTLKGKEHINYKY